MAPCVSKPGARLHPSLHQEPPHEQPGLRRDSLRRPTPEDSEASDRRTAPQGDALRRDVPPVARNMVLVEAFPEARLSSLHAPRALRVEVDVQAGARAVILFEEAPESVAAPLYQEERTNEKETGEEADPLQRNSSASR